MEVRMTGLAKTGRTAQTRQETEQTSRMYLENYTLKNQLKNLNSRDWKQALLQRRQPKKTETSRHPRLKKIYLNQFKESEKIKNQDPSL